MVTRREVLQSATFSIACAIDVQPAAAQAGVSGVGRTLFDSRFPEARAFAEAIRARGGATTGFAGDATHLWFTELRPQWAKAPIPIAGMTTPGTLFCLERWAWDAGMRVTFRVDHRRRRDGRFEHHIATAVDGANLRRSLQEAGADYPRHLAQLLVAGTHARACCASATGVDAPEHLPEPLVTWAITPVARA